MAYKTLGIDHVCINTPKVEEVKQFWMKYMGFKCKGDYQFSRRMVVLKNGPYCVEIYEIEPDSEKQGPCDHICLLVEGIHEMVEDLKNSGCQIDEGPMDAYNKDGILMYSIKFITGLAGERIELYEKFRPDLFEGDDTEDDC